MTKVYLTPEDVARGKVVEPNWYRARIDSIKSQQAKTDNSDGVVVAFRIVDAPQYAQVPLDRFFSLKDKARGFLKPFLVALGLAVPEEGGAWDLDPYVGRELMIFVKNDLYEGRQTNKVEDFRPAVG